MTDLAQAVDLPASSCQLERHIQTAKQVQKYSLQRKKILNSAVAAGNSVHSLLRDETDNSARSECRVVRVRSLFHFHCALDAQDVETATGLTGTLIQIIQTLWCAGHLTAVKIDTTVRERPLGTRRQHI